MSRDRILETEFDCGFFCVHPAENDLTANGPQISSDEQITVVRPRFILTGFQPPKKQKESSAVSLSKRILERLDSGKQDAFDVWDEELTDEKSDGRVIAMITTWLHRKKRFDEAAIGLEAAIRKGFAEPWMYDVLAVEMKLANRPQKQIDRVLLSRIDFSAGNDTQMLFTASNLAAFDAYQESLGVCKELAKRNPHQPELWSTARRVADLSGEFEVRAWARKQTLRNVWEPGFETLHKQMEAELQDLLKEAEKEKNHEAVSMISAALQDGMRRDLRVQIEWVGDGDVDLSIKEPNGLICSRHQKVTANDGLLVKQDVILRASGKRQIEEYVCVDAQSGQYTVKVHHVDGRVLLGRVQLKITQNAGTARETIQTKALTGVVEADQEFRFQYENKLRSQQ